MSIFSGLYTLLIGPLELLFEFIYSMALRGFQDPGISIIVLSLLMNILVLPLYNRADAMQAEERELELRLNPGISRIKKAFTGDERYMMLQTFYRQNHYKPTYALRGSVSLLLEIPFFMAAYNMLSGLNLLHGASFGPISDLGAPDGMLVLAGISINVLPVLMTVINLVNSAFYTRGLSMRSKVQLYAMALIFLVLLYDSPAGLVFYWTLNNIFSLAKTFIGMTKKPGLVAGSLSTAVGIAGLIFLYLIHPMPSFRSQLLVTAALLLLQLPLIYYFLSQKPRWKTAKPADRADRSLLLWASITAALLTGVLIPSAVIHASPEEFINTATLYHPLNYLLHSALLAAGTFLIWLQIFYKLAGPRTQHVMSFAVAALCAVFLVDYMCFSTDLGLLNPHLQFYNPPVFSVRAQLVNIGVLLVLAAGIFLIWRRKAELLRSLTAAACLAVLGMSMFNLIAIESVAAPKLRQLEENNDAVPGFSLSRNGKNVIVIMLDRAINSHIPYIFNEKPEIMEQFQGFTYYPNTISYGGFTNIGTPALYGGYEYTPEEMNRRDQETLSQKQNEALKVMPVSFYQQGYQVTVCDPTYAGYDWIPDISIYSDYPGIETYITMREGRTFGTGKTGTEDLQIGRNLFCYGLFKAAPVFAQPLIYMKGVYHNLNMLYQDSEPEQSTSENMEISENTAEHSGHQAQVQTISGLTRADGMEEAFLRSWNVLNHLPDMTEVTEEPVNTFMMISNDITHSPALLQVPQYEAQNHVDNTEYEAEHGDRFILNGTRLHMDNSFQITHYHVNMAAMIQLGNWLDYLRENQVYDNTRIIIVSDHGNPLNQLDHMKFGSQDHEDIMFFNPLLLVKDFGSTEFTEDTQFMTQCDVPTLAFQDLIQNPVNPITGNPINSDPKFREEQHILLSYDWDVNVNDGCTFLPGYWYAVKGQDALNPANWQYLPDHPLSK